MTYRRYDDDDGPAPQVGGQNSGNQQVHHAIQAVQQGFKQIEQKLQFITSKMQSIPKQTDRQKITQLKNDVSTQLGALVQQDLTTVDQRLQQLSKTVSSLAPDQQPQFMKQYNSLAQQLSTKKQQIQRLQQNFQKASKQIDDTMDASTGNSLQRFQMKQIEQQIDDQYDDIVQINREINNINQAMHVMADEVEKCQETLNIIEDKVNQADKDVEKANENIQATRKHQLAKNKWLWIGLSVIVIIAIILICVFVCK